MLIPMRAVITWTIVFIVLLLSGNVFAAMSEDVSWERDADAAVWDHAVDTGTMPRTSFSSASATRRSSDIRQQARLILERSETPGTSDSAVAAAILKDFAGQGVLPVTAQESSLITGVSMLSSLHHCRGFSWNGKSRDRYGHSILCSAVIAGSGVHRNVDSKKLPRRNYNADNDASNVNLVQYATDYGKADYYGLFLYLWEDGPWETGNAEISISTVPLLESIRDVYAYNPAPSCTPLHIPLKFPFIIETIPGVFS